MESVKGELQVRQRVSGVASKHFALDTNVKVSRDPDLREMFRSLCMKQKPTFVKLSRDAGPMSPQRKSSIFAQSKEKFKYSENKE